MAIDTSKLIDGKAVAARVLEAVTAQVQQIRATSGVTPCLATVLVGADPASATYVRMKGQRCEAVGMKSLRVELPQDTPTERLLAELRRLADDPAIHGILLQHPVPPQVDERAAFEAIPADKDVDGVTATGLGRMWLGLPGFGSCTPAGIMTLLREYQVPLEGMEAVVIGRSPILGKPMAAMLLAANATVTVCHSRTRNLADVVRRAQLVVAAVGKPRFVQGDWIAEGAVVIDAGYNPGNVGDVDFAAALPRASLITPVPGGVGPMTIATLIEQTAAAAARQLGAR
ncbi:MAG: bifunctional 5,10-methylene-tetrahydrofolate dehydrogenase/5,10-methylene-tetrahydrofolate cyclohydrolase [Phycisphaerae bacterium]|nr:bifunctional 5,10-methylene-tetrahydrofolate dehydrogenase/5,10-methylene-tetrahydrofolate cyclohydrolase [Phycisphaerae bacterium]